METPIMTETNHEQIVRELGGINESIKELVRRVGVQNGRVEKSEGAIGDLQVKYQNIEDNNKFIIRLVDGLNKNINTFLEKQDRKLNWWKNAKFQVLLTIMGCLGLGSYLPLLWMYLRKLLKG